MARTSTTIATLHASTGSTTLVLVVLLSALGVAMVLTAVWLVRVTRSDAPALAPLEAMGTRRWTRADEDRRTALLAGARPAGAFPPSPIVPYGDDDPEVEPAATPLASQPDAAGEPVEVVEPMPSRSRSPSRAGRGVDRPSRVEPTPSRPEPEPESDRSRNRSSSHHRARWLPRAEEAAASAGGHASHEPVAAPESS